MKNYLLILIIVFPFLAAAQQAQQSTLARPVFPQKELNKALHEAYLNSLHQDDVNKSEISAMKQQATSVFSVVQKMKHSTSYCAGNAERTAQAIDTVIVGAIPHDTLRITGNYYNNGPIIVANDGVLIFHNANATIIGDMDVFGSGKILADSSSITFPQQYFYQRSLIAIQNSYVHLETCSLSYGGLSHNLLATDSATVELINIHNNDWTTAGTYGRPTITLNGSNLAGEYILSDSSRTSFSNVNTLLVWHEFPNTAIVNFAFPDGDTLHHFTFNKTVSGVSGINYNETIDSSVNVWWGMMPVNGSDITISDSKIRSIGAWFEHGDTVSVSGLVDNSNYPNFVAPLSDRNLHLINCNVETWSVYVFDSSMIHISGCILGEVGGEGRSQIVSSGFFLDGSGGYFWAADTSLIIASSTAVTSNVRSEKSGFFIFGYGTVASGIASAINNSLLIVVQSGLPQYPVAYDGSIAWFANIAQPASALADTFVAVTGSAWIDQGPLGSWMSFSKYSLYYQLQGDTTWTPIVKDSALEIRNNILGYWNTHGLAPNGYTLQLVVYNDLGDSVAALKSVAIMPSVLGVNELNQNDFKLTVYPVPVSNWLMLNGSLLNASDHVMVSIVDVLGRKASPPTPLPRSGENSVIDISALTSGIYFVKVISEKGSWTGKFIKE